MSAITTLEPRLVWEQFDAITRVPRPSKKEGRIIEFLIDFAKRHGIEYRKDAVGNVVMRKSATPGYEDHPGVILQSHMDMVCEKNSDVEFDFEHDAIRPYIDGEWVRAEGTTLGADCGIGMAAALAVLLDGTVEHGPLEALFTVDEETGLTGAFELGEGMLTGKYLLNLDSEDEGELFIGCAGGIDTIATFHYEMEPAPKNYTFFRVDVSDLQGGHSGDDIDKGRVNSNKTVARLLWDGMQSCELRLSYFSGGNLRNAIPREAYAIFGVPTKFKNEFLNRYRLFAADLENEFRFREPNFRITLNEMPEVEEVLDARTQSGLIYSLVGVPNGVVAMSVREVRRRPYDRRHVVAALVGRERQDLRDADGRIGLHAGRCRCRPFGRLSGLGAESRVSPAGDDGCCLPEAFLHGAEGACDPRGPGVRALPGEVPRAGDGVVRPDAAGRPLSRRTARNRHGAEVLAAALRDAAHALTGGPNLLRTAPATDSARDGQCPATPRDGRPATDTPHTRDGRYERKNCKKACLPHRKTGFLLFRAVCCRAERYFPSSSPRVSHSKGICENQISYPPTASL